MRIDSFAFGRIAIDGVAYEHDVKREAARRDVQLIVLSTFEAIEALRNNSDRTNAVLHATC